MPTNAPEYQVPYYKNWYEKNKQAQKQAVALRKARLIPENRGLYWKYRATKACGDCGESDPVVLDADHVRGRKRHDISTMIARGCSWTTILQELQKCEIVCANCHRRRTHHRRAASIKSDALGF